MKKIVLMALALTLGLAGQATAGGGPGKGGKHGAECGEDEACHKEKMMAMRGKMLREKVGLTDEKAKQVETVLDSFHDRHMKLRKGYKDNLKAMKDLIKADSQDQEAFAKALAALQDNHKAKQALMDEQLDALKKILNAKEQAKLFMAHEKMNMKMKKFMKGKKGKGHGKGGGPAPDLD